MHSKRRNRLGQDLVERLVRTHTNLQLEHRLELYEADMLPWDLEIGHPIDSGMGLSITIDKLRVFINKTLSTDCLMKK